MFNRNRNARINVKLVVVLTLIVVALGVSLMAARQVRRNILSQQALTAGHAAFEKGDWPEAGKQFREYLGRNPDDLEILKKYAKALMAVRPIEGSNIGQAIAVNRRVLQLEPHDEQVYEELARLYTAIGNFEELAYIARMRLEHKPDNHKALLWLAEGLIRLDKTAEAQRTLEKCIKGLNVLPDKNEQYVRACVLMSGIAAGDKSPGSKRKAVEWLDKAIDYMPQSVEALATRARFFRVTPDISGLSAEDRRARARTDLDAADRLGTKDPGIRLVLCEEWMAYGDLDRAGAELQAAESSPQEVLEEHFFDIGSFTAAKFTLALTLALRREDATGGAALANEALAALTGKRYRVQILPLTIPLYIADGDVTSAKRCLREYLESIDAQQGPMDSRATRAYLQALVANAEEKPYDVINLLQPVVVSETSGPELWSLLAEAYRRTSQTGRAIGARREYLRLRPQDFQMTLQLAREHLKLRDWDEAFETASIAESLNPTDMTAKVLRIGAAMYLATEQEKSMDTTRLKELESELALLRREHPERVDIRTLQTSVATYLGDPDKTEKELKLALEESQGALDVQMQLVAYYRQAGRIDEAIELCRAACEHDTEIARPWLFLSELHAANSDDDAARHCLMEGLNHVVSKQDKQSLSIQLALLELTRGNRDVGVALLSNLAAQDPQEVRARSFLLSLPEVQKNLVRAETLIEELKQVEGQTGLRWRFHQASLWLSSDGWRSKQNDIAERLQYCMDSDPLWPLPILLLAEMYEKSEDFSRLEDVCRRALARKTSTTTMADKLLRLLERQGRFSEAEQVLKNLQQMDTDLRLTSAWQVRMAARTGDLSQAIDELKLRISDDDRDISARIQLARMIYQENKDANEAFRYLNEAETITSDLTALLTTRVSILKAEGRTKQARRILDDYVTNHKDFNAYWIRAVYLAEEGDLELAEQDYQRLTTFAQQGAAGYLLLSNFHALHGKLDKAVTAIEEGLKAYPENLELKRRLMQCLFLRGLDQDQERADEILTVLEERLPQDPDLMKQRARQLFRAQTPQSIGAAKEKLEAIVKLTPTDVDSHLLLIGIAKNEGQYENARGYAIRAIGSNPNNPTLLLVRSDIELALGNAQTAVQVAQLAVQEDPCNVTALVMLADAYRLSGDADRSRQWIERAEKLDADNQAVFRARCLWLASQKRFEELAKISSTFLSVKEQNPGKVLTLASILSTTDSVGFKNEAVKLFEHALSLSPAANDAKLGLASTLYQIGNAERAKAIYRELLAQYPDNIRVLNDLAWILQEHDHRYQAALELANRGLSLAPDNTHLLDTRGTIFLNMADRLTDARSDFETLERVLPPNSVRQAKTLLKLGRICVMLNDRDRARRHLEKALEIDQRMNVFTINERSEITGITHESGE